jgi:hypothetical protein
MLAPKELTPFGKVVSGKRTMHHAINLEEKENLLIAPKNGLNVIWERCF